jgi:class 3 adenylate cyclase
MTELVNDPLEAGRTAASRYAWADAFTLLTEADAAGRPLTGHDLELLGHSALWVGRLPESLEAYERAYARYLEEGENRSAAGAALFLASEYRNKLQQAVSMGWHQRARRLLENEPDSAERGFLELQMSQLASARGNVDEALTHIRRALEIAQRVGDRELVAQATLREGIALVKKGDVDAGLALIDEVSASAVAGELSPYSTAVIYCTTIDTCRDLADYGRAAEWTDTAMRWCERQNIAGFPGMCRVDRAEIMRMRGAWDEAGRELALACEELEEWNPRVAGAAFYEIGEIRLRRGDLEGAEDAFRRAGELGREVQPGLALLRLAQGKTDAAAGAIKRTLADESWSRLARARLLPAQVEIAIAAGDLRTARGAAEELRSIAEDFKIADMQTPALEAAVQSAAGTVKLAEGDADGALASLRRALKLWREIDAPYEAARTRVLIGNAYLAQGDESGAQEEFETAKAAFERLGATRDARRAADLLSGRRRRTFVFTDIVESTKLAEALGEERWKRVLTWHDELLRGAFARHGGEIVKQTGDGFFAAFEDPGAALQAAMDVQRALAEQGIAPDVRIGVHAAEATTTGDDYTGAGVSAAQRISALAGAGEILASKDTVDGLAVSTRDARTETLKGFSDPVDVVSIDWRER